MSLGFEGFSAYLINRFSLSLPGKSAQLAMAPVDRLPETLEIPNEPQAKISSVIILVFPVADEPGLVLIERNTYEGIHSAQMGLPGGKQEKDDKDLQFTALREANEELGIEHHKVNVVGKLTPLYIPVSKFVVHPYVGVMNDHPVFMPDPREVSAFITLHPKALIDRNNKKLSKVLIGNGMTKEVPSFVLNDKVVWGATAMILSEFSEIIKPYFISSHS